MCLASRKPVLQRLVFDEDTVRGRPVFTRFGGLCQEALRVVLRRCLLRLAQNLRNRRDTLQSMHLKMGDLHDRHAAKACIDRR